MFAHRSRESQLAGFGLYPANMRIRIEPGLGDQEIFLLRFPALSRRRHPARHPAAASPGVRRVLRITVFNCDAALAFRPPALAEELAKVKASVLGDIHQLLLHGCALSALLLDLCPLNASLHCG